MRTANARIISSLQLAIIALLCGVAGVARAQQMQFSKPVPTGAPTAPVPVLEKVGIDQNLGQRVPADISFKDETGKVVTLGDYFAKGKPIVLTPVYYECPMLCTMTLNGITKALKPLKLDVGGEFEVITFSFDPSETPELAAKKKQSYVEYYDRAGAAEGWHFLTGSEDSIKRLTDAIGFRYMWDDKTQQFAHASGIMVLTPDGVIARYFYGLEYSSRDIQLGVVEASEGKVGSLADELLLLCFHYDPASGTYGPAVMRMVRIGGIVTLAGLGILIGLMIRRERRITAAHAAAVHDSGDSPGDEGSKTATLSS